MDGFTEEAVENAKLAHYRDELERAELAADVYQEAYAQAVQQLLRAEDVGWEKLSGYSDFGLDLLQAKKLAAQLADWTESNPLLKQGKQARNSYLFSEPYEVDIDGEGSLSPQQRNLINKPQNQEAVFALSALESIEGERYTAGTAFVLFDRTTKTFQQIPFDEISDLIYDPMNRQTIRYVQRSVDYQEIDSRTGRPVPRTIKTWYPCSTYEPSGKYLTSIGDVKVDATKRMIVSRANVRLGNVLGTPDAYAAAPWALAYSAYLRDGTKVLAALAEWVWKITPKKKGAAEKAAARVRQTGSGNAGGSIFTDMEVQSLPKADAVDLNTGRPLASQAASALGISVVVLLADPGQSGAYGVAQTLADPNRRTMQARRELNTEFLKECLRLLGVRDPQINWAKMAPGTDREEMELIGRAWGTGLFHADEIRPVAAKVAKITLNHNKAPDGVLTPNNAESLPRKDIDADVAPDGSNSQTNGVGRDNLGVGPVSQIKADDEQQGAE